MMERIVQITPAYDKRSTDPAKDYGIGSAKIRFILTGERGAVQFLMSTGWYLHTQRPPEGWDLGYHSPVPRYDGHRTMGPCEYLDGRDCYYDGSTLSAEPIMARLLREGDAAVWEELERYYNEVFGG